MYWFHRKKYLIISVSFLICLSSCSHEVWPNEVDFFTPFKVWQTETKELAVACQNAGGYLGFGQITYLNEKYDAKVSFVTRSLSGFSSNVLINFTNGSGESIALSYKKRRIKKDLFSYYNDRFELYNLEQESSDEYWNNKSIILYSRDMENEELDARYYAGWSLVNKNEGLIFGSIPEKEPREWVLKTTSSEEYHLVFTDKRSFSISGHVSFSGSYSPNGKTLELFFDLENLFLGKYASLPLELK